MHAENLCKKLKPRTTDFMRCRGWVGALQLRAKPLTVQNYASRSEEELSVLLICRLALKDTFNRHRVSLPVLLFRFFNTFSSKPIVDQATSHCSWRDASGEFHRVHVTPEPNKEKSGRLALNTFAVLDFIC